MVQEEERGLLGEAETPVPEPSEEEKERWYTWNLMGEEACAASLSDKAAMYVLDKATPDAYMRDNPACEVRGPHSLPFLCRYSGWRLAMGWVELACLPQSFLSLVWPSSDPSAVCVIFAVAAALPCGAGLCPVAPGGLGAAVTPAGGARRAAAPGGSDRHGGRPVGGASGA